MAKDKKKRIPKHIGGIKLPKELRRAGEKALDQLDTPQGKAMIAGGLSMAAAAIAAAAEKQQASARAAANDPAAAEAPRGGPTKPGMAGIDAQKVGDAVNQLLTGFFGRRA